MSGKTREDLESELEFIDGETEFHLRSECTCQFCSRRMQIAALLATEPFHLNAEEVEESE